MEALESVLGSLSLFERLRPDEVGRVARHFVVSELGAGELRVFPEGPGVGQLVVVVRGVLALAVREAAGVARSRMHAGDRYGDVHLLTNLARAVTLNAEHASTIATLDRTGLEAVLAEFPAVALPLARELASELRARQDLARQLLELHAEDLPHDQLVAAVEDRRATVRRAGARIRRLTPRAIFRRLVSAPGEEPPFWILAGFLVSLGAARLVVAAILKFHLERQLFALVPGVDPNPMHVHHFNYGLLLIGAAGIAALVPLGRRVLRGLAFAFGFGCGLVFDEFALFWNLNPDYRQSGSLIAAGIAAVGLVQLVYFRRFWVALLRRGWNGVRGPR